MKTFLYPLSIALLLGFLGALNAFADESPSTSNISKGKAMIEQGDFANSLPVWRRAVSEAKDESNLPNQLMAYLGLADSLENLGQARLAEQALETADGLAKKDGKQKLLQSRVESGLGTLYMFSNAPEDSEDLLKGGVQLARETGDAHQIAVSLCNLANLHVYEKSQDKATAEYEEAISLAKKSGDRALSIKLTVNLMKCAVSSADWSVAKEWAYRAIAEGPQTPDCHDKAVALLSAGKGCIDVFTLSAPRDSALRLKALDAYQQVEKTASVIHDDRSLSYALAYEGELYEMEGNHATALELTRHAAILAQEVKSAEMLFRWDWQAARILGLEKEREQAITAYGSAVSVLQEVRHDMSLHFGNDYYHSSFREAAGSVYFELADLLLQRANDAKTDAELQDDLKAARDTAEDLKAAELEDYFQDDCANLLKSKIKPIDRLSSTAAIVYIIPLAGRTEILVDMPSGKIDRVKSPATAKQIEDTATTFRFNLENQTTDEYLEQSWQLYDWLIRPILPMLGGSKVDTLVFVPDGALRTIPMAALNDHNEFLIQKFAVATTPGLTLMESKPIGTQKDNLIVDALSEGVQGYAPLLNVPAEVKMVNGLYGGPTLMNQQFSKANVNMEMTKDAYSIVHIASHGHFDSDSKKSYVLTYDGKLTLDEIEQVLKPSQIRDQPIELLTLSACETAAGDDRAALGLAGIAVKAGARSAFATLWCVNDQTSTLMVGDFYSNLHQGISKAKALRQAQLKLLNSQYGHPFFWAPYMIIGNWL